MFAGHQLTVQQFLDKLPKSVIKEGKIIDIRSSVGDTLQVGTDFNQANLCWNLTSCIFLL